jgi:hypothetical protein
MNNIEIIPLLNSYSQEWEIRETDENDNTLEVYGFATEEEAEKFVDEWLLAREAEKFVDEWLLARK